VILYCDTSALVKCYFEEAHSDLIAEERREADAVAVSVVGYAEFHSAVNRKRRDGDLGTDHYRAAIEAFDKDWATYLRVEVSPEVNQIVANLLRQYPLRALDAIHLGSALLLRQRIPHREVAFAGYDDRQRLAAQNEHLPLVPGTPE
jgi:predicted nucleic acid-binding protein